MKKKKLKLDGIIASYPPGSFSHSTAPRIYFTGYVSGRSIGKIGRLGYVIEQHLKKMIGETGHEKAIVIQIEVEK